MRRVTLLPIVLTSVMSSVIAPALRAQAPPPAKPASAAQQQPTAGKPAPATTPPPGGKPASTTTAPPAGKPVPQPPPPGGKPASATTPAQPPAAAPAPAPPAVPPPAKPPAAPVPSAEKPPAPEAYTYRADGRRDPFLNLMGTGTEAKLVSRRGDGAGGLTVSEISVRGIMQSRGALVAMIQGPDNKTYLVHQGDKLLDGTIKTITPQGLVVVQEVNDPLSLIKQREIRKLLRSLEDAKE